MPRLANQANPPPSAIGARTAAYAGPAGRCAASPRISLSLEPRPCSRTTSGAAGSVAPCVATTGGVKASVVIDVVHRDQLGGGADAGPAATSPGRSRRSTGAAFAKSPQLGLGQHPHHLELVAVGVLGVDALGRAVARLAGEGVEVGQGEPRLLELLDGVDLPGQVVEAEAAAGSRRLGADPEQAEVVVVAGPGQAQEGGVGARFARHDLHRRTPAGRRRCCARGRPRTARHG